jgi:2-polyprenyl-6-methoxyphenol hydroxylase-like FAD-dependent oxidoreductase
MSGEARPRVVIVGGSFAGLAAALALCRVGIAAAVFEQAGALRGIEVGVVLQITAMKALKKLGMVEKVRAITGHPIEALQLKSEAGRVLATIPQSPRGRALGTPGFVVHRGEFLAVLARAVEEWGIPVVLNATCTGFEQDPLGVTVRFADGRQERGSVLLGADGLHSVVRREVMGDQQPRYAGYTAWRAMPAFTHPGIRPGILQQASGQGLTFGLYPGRDRLYWFAGKKTPLGGIDTPGGRKREVLSLYGRWFAPIRELIEATEEEAILRNDVYDRVPTSNWGRGRVTLAGDAAHPTTPTLGQGAGMAIEDAVVLAKELALTQDLNDGRAVDDALRAYERQRMPRTAAIVRESWRIGRTIMWEDPLRCRLRDLSLLMTPAKVWRTRGEADAAYEP